MKTIQAIKNKLAQYSIEEKRLQNLQSWTLCVEKSEDSTTIYVDIERVKKDLGAVLYLDKSAVYRHKEKFDKIVKNLEKSLDVFNEDLKNLLENSLEENRNEIEEYLNKL